MALTESDHAVVAYDHLIAFVAKCTMGHVDFAKLRLLLTENAQLSFDGDSEIENAEVAFLQSALVFLDAAEKEEERYQTAYRQSEERYRYE